MTTDILKNYPNVQPLLKKALESPYVGGDGGNIESPIWLCALEWGGGTQTVPDEKYCEGENYFEKRENVINGLAEKRSKIYSVYVMLLTALITGKVDCNRNKDELKKLVDKFDFYSPGHYGFVMNAFPISMPNRDSAPKIWKEKESVEIGTTEKRTSFDEWSSIPTFDEYLDWCTAYRRKYLCHIRREYYPSLIYCGGIGNRNRFFTMWSDEEGEVQHHSFLFNGKTKNLYYRWLDNGVGKNKTLLVVGPFYFGRASCLNTPKMCEELGRQIREVLLHGDTAWLKQNPLNPTTYLKKE